MTTPAALTFAVEYDYTGSPEAMSEVRPEHRAFLRGLLESGQLLASGPLPDVPGALLLVRGEDEAAALALLAPDPFQVAGFVAEVRVRRWDPVIGPWA
ncbi:YciI family protein [Salana multivorans]